MAFLSNHATARRLIDHNSTSPGAVMVVEALGMSAQVSLMISLSPPFSSPPPLFLSLPSPFHPFSSHIPHMYSTCLCIHSTRLYYSSCVIYSSPIHRWFYHDRSLCSWGYILHKGL
ncbi:hypothetical protein KSP40_PGU002605 [Platanthera guangdongensis]|uniref:Uncharacterized protein n=1 Tax=Platanthera guangdongensis TaxID=2320717 RepID=A0ABR2LBM7_9ASPA